MTKSHRPKWIRYEIGTDRAGARRARSLAARVAAARRYFYCLSDEYLYAGPSISGTKIFLGGSVETGPMQRRATLAGRRCLPRSRQARLRFIGDTVARPRFIFTATGGFDTICQSRCLIPTSNSFRETRIRADVEESTTRARFNAQQCFLIDPSPAGKSRRETQMADRFPGTFVRFPRFFQTSRRPSRGAIDGGSFRHSAQCWLCR